MSFSSSLNPSNFFRPLITRGAYYRWDVSEDYRRFVLFRRSLKLEILCICLEINSRRTNLCPHRGHPAVPLINGDGTSLKSSVKFEARDETGATVTGDKLNECVDPFRSRPKITTLPYLQKLPKFQSSQSILSTTCFYSTQNAVKNSFPGKPTATYYDDLINSAGQERDFDTLRHLLNKRARDQVYNTSNTFKFITNTETSLAILDRLTQTLARLDNGFPRSGAFNALIARLCKLDRAAEALQIIKIMANGEFGLSSWSFYPVLSCLPRKKKMEEAWDVVELMNEFGVSPDVTAFNYFLTAYCYTGDVKGADKVLEMMEKAGLGADERTYDALVLGACRAGKVEGALAILRKMEDDGVHVLYSSYMHVINAFLKLGYYEQAMKFVRIYAGRDVKLDMDNFGSLAAKLMKAKRVEEAKLVLEEMEKRGLVINRTGYFSIE